MSGSGKPGKIFKIRVVSTGVTSATIQAESEDIAYLVPGNDYMVQVTPVGGGSGIGSGKPSAQSSS
jgi:hypothetical protein